MKSTRTALFASLLIAMSAVGDAQPHRGGSITPSSDRQSLLAEFGDWNRDVHPSDDDFVFQPPAGAAKVAVDRHIRQEASYDAHGDGSWFWCAAGAFAGDRRLRVESSDWPARRCRISRPNGGSRSASPLWRRLCAGRGCGVAVVLHMGMADMAIAAMPGAGVTAGVAGAAVGVAPWHQRLPHPTIRPRQGFDRRVYHQFLPRGHAQPDPYSNLSQTIQALR
jgi:hypothetical protein